MDFSERLISCGLQICRYRQYTEIRKYKCIEGHGHFGQMSFSKTKSQLSVLMAIRSL